MQSWDSKMRKMAHLAVFGVKQRMVLRLTVFILQEATDDLTM